MERSGSGDLDKVYREIESVTEQVREQRAYIERQREERRRSARASSWTCSASGSSVAPATAEP
ncbi:MAG: hypothetical protein U5L11_02195 [Arhodomonas sp.]|nr:hypothetical protein [Arhodomonas sp.]